MKNLFSKVWNHFNRKNIEIEKLQEANKALDQENFRLTISYNVEWDISTYREKRIVKLEKEKSNNLHERQINRLTLIHSYLSDSLCF